MILLAPSCGDRGAADDIPGVIVVDDENALDEQIAFKDTDGPALLSALMQTITQGLEVED